MSDTSVEQDPVSGSRFNRILRFRTGSVLDWISKISLAARIWISKLRWSLQWNASEGFSDVNRIGWNIWILPPD